MKTKRLFPLLATAWLLAGCQLPQATPPPGSSLSTRNNCYSLLHQLLDEQKDVSILRFFKREDSDVKVLTKTIAAASGAGAKLLEDYARHDHSIRLDDISLPPGEVATREAIASTKKKNLLSQKDGAFELDLLLSQSEALSYGWHLAQVAEENEPDPERGRAVTALSKEMERLYQEVYLLLQSRQEGSAK